LHKTLALGKRIFRLSAQDALSKTELVGKELHFVLLNSTVFFGILKKTENDCFVCENMLGKKFQFPTSEIREIIYDQPSNY